MVIDTSKMLNGSWKTTVSGAIGAGLIWLNSYLQNSHTINWHDPQLLIGLAMAVMGYVAKDSNVTGGTVVNSNNDPKAVAATAVPKV